LSNTNFIQFVMRRFYDFASLIMTALWAMLYAHGAYAGISSDAAANAPTANAPLARSGHASPALKEVEEERDRLRERASNATSDMQLIALDSAAKRDADRLDNIMSGVLLPERAKVEAQLDVLGPAPVQGATREAIALSQQRVLLEEDRAQIDAEIANAGLIKRDLENLDMQIARLRHDRLRTQLSLRTSSMLTASFWKPVVSPDRADVSHLKIVYDRILQRPSAIWALRPWPISTLYLLLALAMWAIGRRLLERAVVWFCLHRLPDSRLRRSMMALGITLVSVLCIGCFARFACFLAIGSGTPTQDLQDFTDEIMRLAWTCSLASGLGKTLLSVRRPSWRLPAMADAVAAALKPFPAILAALLMVFGTVEHINKMADTSVQLTLCCRGLVSLVVSVVIGASLLRANRVRHTIAAAGEPPEARSTLAGLIHAGVSLVVVVSLLALMIGYITVARFLTYELVWFEIVLCSFYLLTRLTHDLCESILSVRHGGGRTLKHLFGLADSRLEQASTIVSGAGRGLLVFMSVLALFTGGFGIKPSSVVHRILTIFGPGYVRDLDVVRGHAPNALLTFAIGIYLVRSLRGWLEKEFLPKTGMGADMRTSLLALLSNIGYVFVALLTLSAAGVEWSSLAWIVSALSVGIGFGLQEIVKNFISGVILLTERPVKVGDLVSIDGVEGDIRRINVRATEIRLADRSIVTVPNSQLLSHNLRNVTMGNRTEGVTTLTLTFPLDTDPEEVRHILIGSYEEHPAVLEYPAPSVLFSQLTPQGITLNVTGYVSSPRVTGDVKSELLFDILKRLRYAGIKLSNPETVRVEHL
jgi:potassium efflux system protein